MKTSRTALSPEWDRGFDEAFTDLVTADEDLVRAEFDALTAVSWLRPPAVQEGGGSPRHTDAAGPPPEA